MNSCSSGSGRRALNWPGTKCTVRRVHRCSGPGRSAHRPHRQGGGAGHVINMDFGLRVDDYVSGLQRTWYVLREGESEPPESVRRGLRRRGGRDRPRRRGAEAGGGGLAHRRDRPRPHHGYAGTTSSSTRWVIRWAARRTTAPVALPALGALRAAARPEDRGGAGLHPGAAGAHHRPRRGHGGEIAVVTPKAAGSCRRSSGSSGLSGDPPGEFGHGARERTGDEVIGHAVGERRGPDIELNDRGAGRTWLHAGSGWREPLQPRCPPPAAPALPRHGEGVYQRRFGNRLPEKHGNPACRRGRAGWRGGNGFDGQFVRWAGPPAAETDQPPRLP